MLAILVVPLHCEDLSTLEEVQMVYLPPPRLRRTFRHMCCHLHHTLVSVVVGNEFLYRIVLEFVSYHLIVASFPMYLCGVPHRLVFVYRVVPPWDVEMV